MIRAQLFRPCLALCLLLLSAGCGVEPGLPAGADGVPVPIHRAEVLVAALSATPATVATGGTVTVAVTGGPANTNDWVGLFRSGDPDTSPTDWQYLNGTKTPPATGSAAANLSFRMPTTAGTYQFRFFANETFTKLATSNDVTVTATMNTPTVTASPTTVAPGGMISVAIANGPANPTDWVALVKVGDPDTNVLDWKYLNGTRTAPAMGVATAMLGFTAPTMTGSYDFRFFSSDTFTKLATSNTVTVQVTMGTPALAATPATVTPGGTVSVAVTGGPANTNDWVGLFLNGDPDTNPLDWQYLSGTKTPPATGLTNATLSFRMPTVAGTYQFRFFSNESFTKIATSNNVTVAAGPQIAVSTTTPMPGQAVTATVTGGPGNPTDWIVLAREGDDDRILLDWKYLNGTRTPPAMGLTTATVGFTVPTTAGRYVVRLFASDGFTKLATSPTMVVP